MKYYVPILEQAKIYNSQTGLKEKFGGIPFGLSNDKYPFCKQCGNPMGMLVQFVHNSERLNLGREGRILFVFQCNYNGFCETWDADSGANACFIIEPEDLTGQTEKLPDGNVQLEKEFWVVGWQEFDDGVGEKDIPAFFDETKYYEYEEDEFEELIKNVTDNSRLGGVPYWVQYPEVPTGDWSFVGQLDDNTGFNFGDAGTGYIFIENLKDGSQLPKGKFLWQCH
jgi:uncharacterized protein YwqG